MSPRMFNAMKFFGAVLSFVVFGLITYHLVWLYSLIPTLNFVLGFLTKIWMLVVMYYWVGILWEYINPNSSWWRRMRSKGLDEFNTIATEEGLLTLDKDTNLTKTMERKKAIETKFADIRIVKKSETILGYFNGSPIHESITVRTGGREIVLPYNASYTSMEEIPTKTKTDCLLVIIGSFITYALEIEND